jgi:hypothetical protein
MKRYVIPVEQLLKIPEKGGRKIWLQFNSIGKYGRRINKTYCNIRTINTLKFEVFSEHKF